MNRKLIKVITAVVIVSMVFSTLLMSLGFLL